MVLYGLIPAFILGILTGGRPQHLAEHRLQMESTLVILLALMMILPAIGTPVSDVVMVYAAWALPAAACVVIAGLNRLEPGFVFVLIGLSLNLLVVMANRGMPVLTANTSLVATGIDAAGALAQSWLHLPAGDSTFMLVLADVIPVPGPSGFRGMMSLGDFLLLIGVAEYVVVRMHTETK